MKSHAPCGHQRLTFAFDAKFRRTHVIVARNIKL